MEDFTRLEKVIEATAEAETDLKPETRLEKVILDTGAKIQEEIAEGGGTLYNHKISILYSSSVRPSFNILSYSSEPFTLNDVINYLIDNEYTGASGGTTNGLTINQSVTQFSSSPKEYRYLLNVYYDNLNPNAITLHSLILRVDTSPATINYRTGAESNITDTITEIGG